MTYEIVKAEGGSLPTIVSRYGISILAIDASEIPPAVYGWRDLVEKHLEWSVFNSELRLVYCLGCGEKVPYETHDPSGYDEHDIDLAMLAHGLDVLRRTLVEDRIEAALRSIDLVLEAYPDEKHRHPEWEGEPECLACWIAQFETLSKILRGNRG